MLLILSIIGVLNGFLLSIYFGFVVRPRQKYNYFLAALLLVLSIRIGKSVIFYFFYDTPFVGTYIQIGLSACFLIGPFLYLFIKEFFGVVGKIDWKIHIGVMLSIALLVGVLYPYVDHQDLWVGTIIWIIFLQWFVYSLAAGKIILDHKEEWSKNNSSWKSKYNWVISIYAGTSIIWLAYVSAGLTSYMLGAVSFTFMLYIFLFILLISKSERVEVIATPHSKYGGRVIQEEKTQSILNRLKDLFEDEAFFSDPNLKLQKVADRVQVPSHELSQLLNEKLNTNFPGFLNQHRISKAKEMIKTNDQLSLEGIGYECGYNAKSTFYAAFKKETGTTPAQYKKNLSQRAE